MMQYGFKLSTKHPPKTNNNFRINHLVIKDKTFYNIRIKIKMFCNKIILVLNILPILCSACMFLVQIDRQKKYPPKLSMYSK